MYSTRERIMLPKILVKLDKIITGHTMIEHGKKILEFSVSVCEVVLVYL